MSKPTRALPVFQATETPVDLACVTYEGDAHLMVLQILSVDRMIDHENLGEYAVILNGADNAALERFFREQALSRITPALRDKIRFIDGHRILGAVSAGWRDQQAIKLLVANYLHSEFYLLLDAKNHFIRPALVAEFFQGGKPKTHLKPMSEDWVQYMRHSLRPYKALTEDNIKVMPPTVTPYVMIRSEALAVVRRIEDAKGKGFTEAFDEMGDKATEFFLYYGHFISERDHFPYADAPTLGTTLYTVFPKEPERVHVLIEEAGTKNHALFGLHRKRLPQLTDEQRTDITALWRRHLLLEWEDANWFMTFQETPAS